MRIVGCLSWFDESPAWLAASVASAGRFCDHLVAVDGAYALFPGAEPRSASDQHEAIRETSFGLGMGLTIHAPREVWWGNEIEKRNRLLALALLEAEPEVDWLYIFDADTVARIVPADLRDLLAAAEEYAVAGVSLVEIYDLQEWPDIVREHDFPARSTTPMHRMFYRALPGLRVRGAHWHYIAGEGEEERVLWGSAAVPHEEALDLSCVKVEHRSNKRDLGRRRRALGYYAQRDAMQIEKLGATLMEGTDGELHEVGA